MEIIVLLLPTVAEPRLSDELGARPTLETVAGAFHVEIRCLNSRHRCRSMQSTKRISGVITGGNWSRSIPVAPFDFGVKIAGVVGGTIMSNTDRYSRRIYHRPPAKTFFIAALCGVAVSALPFDLGNGRFRNERSLCQEWRQWRWQRQWQWQWRRQWRRWRQRQWRRRKANRPQLAGRRGRTLALPATPLRSKCAENRSPGKEKSTAAKVAKGSTKLGKGRRQGLENSRSPRCRRSRLHPRRKT